MSTPSARRSNPSSRAGAAQRDVTGRELTRRPVALRLSGSQSRASNSAERAARVLLFDNPPITGVEDAGFISATRNYWPPSRQSTPEAKSEWTRLGRGILGRLLTGSLIKVRLTGR